MAKKKKAAKKSRHDVHTKKVVITLTDDMYQLLGDLAFAQDRSAGAMVRHIVKRYIERETGRPQ